MSGGYAGARWIGPAHPENYRAGRTDYNPPYRTFGIQSVALHHTATDLAGAIATFQTAPASGKEHSAHFIVDLDGSRYQMVDIADTAFALGVSWANCQTVNIEVVQTWDFARGVKTSDFTDAQYAAVSDICQVVAADNGFAVRADTVKSHNFYVGTACPGDLDMARVVQGADDMFEQPDRDLLNSIFANVGGGSPATGGTVAQQINGKLDAITAAIATMPAANNAAVLAAIADLKAHPGVAADPALAAKVDALGRHLGIGSA
jgi:N-acetylmuramoyl-L-alanine amidase